MIVSDLGKPWPTWCSVWSLRRRRPSTGQSSSSPDLTQSRMKSLPSFEQALFPLPALRLGSAASARCDCLQRKKNTLKPMSIILMGFEANTLVWRDWNFTSSLQSRVWDIELNLCDVFSLAVGSQANLMLILMITTTSWSQRRITIKQDIGSNVIPDQLNILKNLFSCHQLEISFRVSSRRRCNTAMIHISFWSFAKFWKKKLFF